MGHTHIPPDLPATVEAVAKSLAPDVVRIRYTVGEDWHGEPCVYFRTVLSDAASHRAHLLVKTHRVEAALRKALDFTSMGLGDYYNYRSQSECEKLRDKDWD